MNSEIDCFSNVGLRYFIFISLIVTQNWLTRILYVKSKKVFTYIFNKMFGLGVTNRVLKCQKHNFRKPVTFWYAKKKQKYKEIQFFFLRKKNKKIESTQKEKHLTVK